MVGLTDGESLGLAVTGRSVGYFVGESNMDKNELTTGKQTK